MAQSKQISWSDLRLGIFVMVAVVLIAAGILYITGGSAFTSRYTLLTYLPNVDGLEQGATVTLDGIEVGNVSSVAVAEPAAGQPVDPNRSVRVEMRIDHSYQQYIRSDSVAGLETQGFVGDRSVTIRRGLTGRVLQNGEAVPGQEENGMAEVFSRGADLMQNLNVLSKQLQQVVGSINQGKGTLGKLLVDESAYNHLNNTLGKLDAITASVQQGQGTLGKLLVSDTIYNKTDSAIGHVDNITAAIEDQKGSIGKLIYDPAFHDQATQFLAHSNDLLTDVHAGRGTLGKLATDDSLFQAWRQTGDNLRDATAKLNSGSNTAGKFFSDPQLYDNLAGLTGDMRLLLGEFRANPKKFLQIRLQLF